jgi:hypothetical protein
MQALTFMSMKSTAVDKGDHWLINATRHGYQMPQQPMQLFFMPTPTGKQGARDFQHCCGTQKFNGVTTTDLDKLGTRSTPTGEIILEDCKVPKRTSLETRVTAQRSSLFTEPEQIIRSSRRDRPCTGMPGFRNSIL